MNPWPQPLQKPHPPVWLAGGGSVETYEMAVNYDYTYSFLSFFGYQYAQAGHGHVLGRRQLGSAPTSNPYRAGFAQQICVSETDAKAEEDYLEHVTYFFKKCLHIPPYYFETPGYRTRRSTEFALKTNQPGDIVAAVHRGEGLEVTCRQGVHHRRQPRHRRRPADRGMPRASASETSVALLEIGSMPHDLTKQNLTLFAEGVMPQAPPTVGGRRLGSTSGGRRAPGRTASSRERRRPGD